MNETNTSESLQPATSTPQLQATPAQPAPQSSPPAPELGQAPRFDPSKIYPTPQQTMPTGTSSLNGGMPVQPQQATSDERVATRVSSLQIYAILMIISSLLIFLALSFLAVAFGHSAHNAKDAAKVVVPLLAVGFVIAGTDLALGSYLLTSRNIRTVNTVLTVLLALNVLSVLGQLPTFLKAGGHYASSAISSLIVPVALLIFLWYVKSQVAIEAQK